MRTVKSETKEINKYAVMITFDVKNAFNSAPWQGIIKELKRREIAPYLIRLICSYFENRHILIGDNTKMTMSCGVPQGSVLGPTLWNFYYDGVLNLELPIGTRTIGYADDLALLAFGNTREEMEEKIVWSMSKIDIRMNQKRLNLAPEKTEIVILEGRRKLKEINIRFNNQNLRNKKSLKYLGVQIGHNMNMWTHIKYVAGKAEKTAAALGRLMPNIGGPKAVKRKVLGSVVNSIILYCAPVWNAWVEKKTFRRIIERVQRKTAIRTASAYRTVSTKAIQVIAGAIPIHLLAKERSYGNKINNKAHRQQARNATIKTWQMEWDLEKETAQWTKKLIPMIEPWLNRTYGQV